MAHAEIHDGANVGGRKQKAPQRDLVFTRSNSQRELTGGMMVKAKNPTDVILKELRAFGLAYPGAHTKSPWPGHLDLAVNDKTFAYLSLEGEPLSISCKLPRSAITALALPFTKPTAYGLGKSGWVTAEFPKGQRAPVALLKEWIDESYRAQAPKRLVASLSKKPGTA